MKKIYFPALIAGLTALPAVASETLDANGDGVFSLVELVETYPTLNEEAFGILDVNQDGAVDAQEFSRAKELGLLPDSET